MSDITHNDPLVTESKLTEFYNDIKPFLGCPAYVTQEGDAEYYSTDEKVIGRWIDGKPLYQKVIYVDSLTFNNVAEKDIDTSALLNKNDIIVREFVGSYYCDLNTNTEQHHNFGYDKVTNTEYYYTAYYRQAVDVIKIRGTWGGINPWTIYRLLFVFKYTKKSDSAATTVEQKPTHYSTDEQVVGTWVDGKPIYQKTVVGVSPITTTDGTLANGEAIAISEVCDQVVKVEMTIENNADPIGTGQQMIMTNSQYFVKVNCERGTYPKFGVRPVNNCTRFNGLNLYITVQYTKTTD